MADLCPMPKGEWPDQCYGECALYDDNVVRCKKCEAEFPFHDGEPDAECPNCKAAVGDFYCSLPFPNLRLDPTIYPYYANGFGKIGPFNIRICHKCGMVFYPLKLIENEEKEEE